jgi:hypothetical protein
MSRPTEEELRSSVRNAVAAAEADERRNATERLRRALEENGDNDE